jgi:hypothetical protein
MNEEDDGVPRSAVFDAAEEAETAVESSDAALADEVDEFDEAWAKRGVGEMCERRSGLLCTPRAAEISLITAAAEGTAVRALEIGLSRISASAGVGLAPLSVCTPLRDCRQESRAAAAPLKSPELILSTAMRASKADATGTETVAVLPLEKASLTCFVA